MLCAWDRAELFSSLRANSAIQARILHFDIKTANPYTIAMNNSQSQSHSHSHSHSNVLHKPSEPFHGPAAYP